MRNIKLEHAFQWAICVLAGILSIAIFLECLVAMVSNNTSIPDETPIQLWAARFVGHGMTLATVAGTGTPYELPRKGELVLWDLNTCKARLVMRQNSSLRAIAVSPDGKLLATGDFDGLVKVLRADTGTTIFDRKSDSGVNAIALAPKYNKIISGSLGGAINSWDMTGNGTCVAILTNEAVLNIAISPDGNALVATTRSGTGVLLNLVQPLNRIILHTYDGPFMDEPDAEGAAFAPDGRCFATACQSHVRFWKYPSGRLINQFNAQRRINSIAFSPNGKTLAFVDADGMLSLLDVASTECQMKINAHSGTSFCVTFSPDGKLIATIGRDDFLTKIWDAHTLALRLTLTRNNR